MIRWKILPGPLDERSDDYTADFDCMNVDTGNSVKITFTQRRDQPASDLIGALRALAALMYKAATGEDAPGTAQEKLN